MIFGIIVLIVILSLVLIKSADLVVVAIRRLGKGTSSNIYVISALLLALSTSFPELFVGITSAIEGSPNLILGVVLGSNIANISLVAGLTALITGKIRVSSSFLKKDVSVSLVAGILPMILMLDRSLNRVDGLILLVIYFAYATGFFRSMFYEIGHELQTESFVYRILTKTRSIDAQKTKEYGRLFIGVALLLFSADAIVKLSTTISELAGFGVFAIGLIVVAMGTSLPEFAFSLKSIERKEPTMFFGNLLGSIIANSTLVLGISALIHPINVGLENGFLIASIAFAIAFLTFWYFIRTKLTLERKEGLVLLLIYIIFLAIEFFRA